MANHQCEKMTVLLFTLLIPLLSIPPPALTMDSETFHQQITEIVMQTLDKSLKAAVTSMSGRQDRVEETNWGRINSLNKQISELGDLILKIYRPESHSTQSEEIIRPPPTRTESPAVDSNPCDTPPSLDMYISAHHPTLSSTSSTSLASPLLTSSPRSLSTNITKADLNSSKHTLGFFPINNPQLQADSSENSLTDAVTKYLEDNLLIEHNDLCRIEVKHAWFDSKKCMVFAEFYSMQMCFTIFKHMSNLKGINRVEKFIHPLLKPSYYTLSNLAHSLRHEHGYYSTRIDYSLCDLVLLVKTRENSPWSELETLPQVSNSGDSREPCDSLSETDGYEEHIEYYLGSLNNQHSNTQNS